MCSIDGPAMQAATDTTPANGASESPKEYWIVADKYGSDAEVLPSRKLAEARALYCDFKYSALAPHRILYAIEMKSFAPVEAAA